MAVAAVILVAAIVLDGRPPAAARWTAVLLLAASVPLFALPFRHLPRHGAAAPGGSYMDTTRVAEGGVYAVVRHPQYLGYALLVAGFALLTWHPVLGCLAALAALGFHAQAREEERFLRSRFGAGYQAYAARVPRFNLVAGIWRLLRRGRRSPS